ncbi:TonB-dependent receptor [Phenylobacterium sp.]|uniref:TonB-dependent receptor n=1 Tax=Phenylobacterium sp. TaxID=1871053 RepID=UPI0027179ED0|nr:TonB-dependent receptor [Phenylobacterium sp.]MDO8801743.1 TonB-dependent receptor [Phenylobacterium sp.]
MPKSEHRRQPWAHAGVAAVLAVLAGGQAQAQTGEVDELIVTGFRASLASAIEIKKKETALVDVINAEDMADFPDLNLAEALQRIPGVAIDRDGGEGRSITVRGLPGDFSRVRLNGLEALATTGGKDTTGGANRGRSFDFQVFASELFNRVTVRKSQTADVEEGSLGATIDLATARPFDNPGFHAAGSLQYGYNDLSRKADPRATALISDTWFDGKLGALVSVAYSARNILEEGATSGRWENPSVPTNSGGCFLNAGACNSPAGVYSPVNSAWHARIPRYERLTYDWRRYGTTAAVQFAPTEATTFTFDALFALFDGTRQEEYLTTYLTRLEQTLVRNPVFGAQNQMVSATFDDTDIRSEVRYDELSSEFSQLSLRLEHEFSSRFKMKAVIGQSRSIQDNPVQTTVSFDRYNQDGYSYDFSASQTLPVLNYNFDVTDPSNWQFSSSAAQGFPSLLRQRPNKTSNRFKTLGVDGEFKLTDGLTLKGGLLFKDYRFVTADWRQNTVNGLQDAAVPLPGVALAQISTLVSGFGRGLGAPAGTPNAWLAPDVAKIAALVDLYCNCVNAFGDFRVSTDNQRAANREVGERDLGLYVQADFATSVFGMPLRGNFGVRRVSTTSIARGYVGTNYVAVSRKYDDTLPALNLVLEPREDVLVRVAAAKVMARPQLPSLTPGGSINNTAHTLTIGNPLLDPVRANTFDLSFEWYRASETQFSVGVFYKDLQSYIQSSAATMPYSATGLPVSLLTTRNGPDTIFLVTQLLNTAGGELKGYEINLQGPFSFLPAPFDRFGGIANYTHADSTVTYITDSSVVPRATTVLPLVGLSPRSWNATLYYEDTRLSARVSASYRDEYLAAVPGGNGNDARGKNSTLNVDFSANYKISEQFSLTFEGINLTDEFEDRWISIERRNSEDYTHTGRQFYLGARYRF